MDAGASGSDAQLLEASRRGERDAFGVLVERYQRVVGAVSRSATGSVALGDDVTQDTFVTAWRSLGSLRDANRLGPWLCGIARNLGRRARRRRARETALDDVGPDPALIAAGDPFAATSAAQASALVQQALDQLPAAYREVLILYYQEGQSARHVGAALGLGEAAVMQRLSRGRAHLSRSVADLVERTLATPPTTPSVMRQRVLAALPLAPAGHVAPPPPPRGSSMLKIAIATIALSAAGTTAYVVHRPTPPAPAAPHANAAAITTPAPPAPDHAPASVAGSRPAVAAPPRPGLTGAPAAAPRTPPAPPPIDPRIATAVHLYDGPSRGPADAPLTIAVFTDLKCEFCGQALGLLDELSDDHPGQLRVVVKQFPVHETARLPAEAAMAADAQGKFWELHDLMFANQDALTRADLERYAAQVGLDVDAFRAALDAGTYAASVAAQVDAGKALGVPATPTFAIGDELIVGALPIEVLRAKVDAALAARR